MKRSPLDVPTRQYGTRIAAALTIVALLAVVAFVIRRSEIDSRHQIDDRLNARVELASSFLQSYVQDILARERRAAERHLAGEDISPADVNSVVEAFGFDAAVLLDSAGHLSLVTPPRPDIVGDEFTPRYDHLRQALERGTAVSIVVLFGGERRSRRRYCDSMQGHRWLARLQRRV